MQRTGTRARRFGTIVLMTGAVLVSTAVVLAGCSIAGERGLPADLETQLASNGTADDHMAAALFYQREAERARADAEQYEVEAAAISPLEDTKGFRRNALITAAQARRKEAGDMMQRYATHQTKAQTMSGWQQPKP